MSDTEKSLLGALLQDPSGLSRARARLGAGSFSSQECALVWDSICRLTDEAQHVDLVTVTGKLANMGLLDSAGGAAGVAGLLDRAGDPDQTDSYVSLIDEAAARRGLITLGNRLLSAAEANQDPWKLMSSHKDDLDKLSARRADSKVINSATLTDRTDKFIEAAAQLGGRMPGVSTGFSEVDSITGGMQRSDLVVIGARPSVGKTASAINLVHAACSNRKRVVFFSLEMSAVQVGMRLRSIDACVDLQRLRFGLVNEYERLQLDNSSLRMKEWRLYVDDSSSLMVQEIRSKCSLIKSNGGLDLIVVDYVQIMGGISADNTAYNIGASMYGLKALAKELDCCVVALAQLNRKSEQDDREPVLSDLKGSGGLEEAADVVILLHREQETKDVACHWIVAKQRNGPTGKVTLGWNAPIASFTNVTVVEEHLTE